MAIVFQKNCRNTFITMLYSSGLANANPVTAPSAKSVAFTIYGGVQPSAATIVSSWPSYYNTFLLHLSTGASIVQLLPGTVDLGISLTNSGIPTAQTSNAAGTATWAIIWGTQYNPLSYPTTIPNIKFLVVPVSDTSGTAPMRLASTTIASATAYTISDLSITAAGGLA